MAHTRYLLYAQKANEESFPSIARLFRALAFSRYIRSREYYHLASELIGTHTACSDTYFTFVRTIDHLERARNDESHEADEVIPAFIAVADSEGEGGAVKCLKRSAVICRQRAALTDSVLVKTRHASAEPVIKVYVCEACGNIVEEPLTVTCAVCDAGLERFLPFE